MELRHLRSFLAVANRLNFSKAAAALNMTQPALSRQIRDLEKSLECRLFDRGSTGVRLTADGERLKEKAAALVDSADELRRSFGNGDRKAQQVCRLAHFGTFISLHVAPFVQRLQLSFPSIRIELVELDPVEALAQLAQRRIDAAIVGSPSGVAREGLGVETIWSEQPMIVLACDHPLAKRRKLTLRDLAREPWLIWDEARFPGFGQPFVTACQQAGFLPNVIRTVDSISTVFADVACGDGVGYVGRLACQVRVPGVVFVELAAGQVDMPVALLWRLESRGAPAFARLGSMLADARGPVLKRTGRAGKGFANLV